jgi:DNA replicative helicase MCM subunit Mcm2 (Cdc46/Mcm family)
LEHYVFEYAFLQAEDGHSSDRQHVSTCVAKLCSDYYWRVYTNRILHLSYNIRHSPLATEWYTPSNYQWLAFEATPRDLWPQRYERLVSNVTVTSLAESTPDMYSTAYTCRKCKSTRVEMRQLQTRSADEPMTAFFHCFDCDKRWRTN